MLYQNHLILTWFDSWLSSLIPSIPNLPQCFSFTSFSFFFHILFQQNKYLLPEAKFKTVLLMLYRGISQPAHLITASFLIMPISLLAPPIDPDMEILNQYLWKIWGWLTISCPATRDSLSPLSPLLPLTEVSTLCSVKTLWHVGVTTS